MLAVPNLGALRPSVFLNASRRSHRQGPDRGRRDPPALRGLSRVGNRLQQAHTQNVLRNTLVHKARTKRSASLWPNHRHDTLPTGRRRRPDHRGPAEGSPVGEIRIPAIGIDQVIVSGTATQDLREGPGHYTGTPLPGQAGNSAVAGHRTTYGTRSTTSTRSRSGTHRPDHRAGDLRL